MPKDALQEFNSMGTSVALMAFALLIGVGSRKSGLRSWIGALLWQSLAWGALSASIWAPAGQRFFSTAGSCFLIASVSCMYLTACHYLARRPTRAWVYAPAVLATVACLASNEDGALRLISENVIICFQTAYITWLLWPRSAEQRTVRWRWLAFGSYGFFTSGLIFSVFAKIEQASHQIDQAPEWVNSIAAAVNSSWPMICTVAFLLAHRDEAERALARLAQIDGLTGLLNRRAFMERANDAMTLANRRGQACALLMMDIDHFKRINDSQGHQVGDAVLIRYAQVLTHSVRDDDLVGRYGGEEFCILLRNATTEDARAVDDRVRKQLATLVSTDDKTSIEFSAGLARSEQNRVETIDQLIGRADRALYSAKAQGRGRLILA